MNATLPAQNERTMENGSVAFTPDGRTLVAWGVNREVALWDWHAARMAAPLLPMIYRPRDVVFHGGAPWSPCRTTASMRKGRRGFSTALTEPRFPPALLLNARIGPAAAVFPKTDAFLLSGLRLGLKLWDWRTGAPRLPGHARPGRQ